ncbi:MAG: hypothetical protein ABFR63_03465 [Thermodesulfobacteriota bacterium]
MKQQCAMPNRGVFWGQRLLLLLLVSFFLCSPGQAATKTKNYQGNGITFDYPAKYALSEQSKKSSEKVSLKNGNNTIDIEINNNVLVDGFDDIVIQNLGKNFKAKGFGISGEKKESKQIPLQVKGESEPVQVDAVKFSNTIAVPQGESHINIEQTMFFFSYGDHGYTVNYMATNGKYSELVTVLSSFTFDEKEVAEDAAKASAY